MNKDNLMKALECRADMTPPFDCEHCDYLDRSDEWGTCDAKKFCTDVFALLKEQEAEISKISNAYLDLVGKASKQPEIVRCKDCKWWDKKENSPYGYCHACKHGHYSEHWEIGIYRRYKGDWFCADAERKND